MRAHEKVVEAQFGPRAKAYVESVVHAKGEDLTAVEASARAHRPARALDMGCGGGHVAYAMARHAGTVTATDLSADMLAAVAATARDRKLTNIEIVEAPAEKLPFADGTFDFLGCRYSAHHWRDFEAGLRKARRVLKRQAPAIFIDVYAPGQAMFDTHLQAVELLRDTSHVRDYSAAEWFAGLGRAGFAVQAHRTWRLRMDFPTWTARMRTPPDNIRAIHVLQEAASAPTRAHFEIEANGSFKIDVLMAEVTAE